MLNAAFHRLDLAARKDRAGRWTRTLHNAVRQPVAEIGTDGCVTQFEWCRCGHIRKLIDPNRRETTWKRDLLRMNGTVDPGRV